MNKKGVMRIIEASIAIVIIAGFLFYSYNVTRVDSQPDLSENAREVLYEISQNSSLRRAVLQENDEEVDAFVSSRIVGWNYEVKICEIREACGKSTYTEGNVYSAERVISAQIGETQFSPKKVRMFIW